MPHKHGTPGNWNSIPRQYMKNENGKIIVIKRVI